MKRSTRTLIATAVAALLVAACEQEPTSPTPTASADQAAALVAEAGQHIVMFFGPSVPDRFDERVRALGGSVETTLPAIGAAVVSGLDDQAASRLRRERGVASVEADVIMPLDELPDAEDGAVEEAPETHDPSTAFFYPRQWHHKAISADAVWAAGYLGSEDVVVSIIDTGIDYNHASLEGLVDLDRSISLHRWDDAELAELYPGAHPIADLSRHGTHVAATVVSTGEVGAGVTGHTTLFGVKVCGYTVGCPRSAVLEAIVYSADQGADIINMSLGGTFLRRSDRGNWLPLIHRATNYAHSKGALIVVSAGNDAADLDHDDDAFKSYCNSSNVVCVAGTGPTIRESINGPWNDFDQPYFATNYGHSAIDVAAPSGNYNNFVYAACSSFSQRNPTCQRSNRFIIGLRGTSMAAPHATGVAALIVAHVVGKGNPALVRNHLAQTADEITGTGHDAYFGRGRINAARAVGLE